MTCGKDERKLVVRGMRAGVKVLVQHLGAAVDARDQAGRTAVHWMVFTAISDYSDDEVQFKPPDPRLQRGLLTAGVKPGAGELKEPFLVSQTSPRIRWLALRAIACGSVFTPVYTCANACCC